uniref:Uncharacterized protein n=1 Tax=Anguilla anguilla TaxID=7936 RepID=A0A0E9SM37_ANGAN
MVYGYHGPSGHRKIKGVM